MEGDASTQKLVSRMRRWQTETNNFGLHGNYVNKCALPTQVARFSL
jgi:hypothetical protein